MRSTKGKLAMWRNPLGTKTRHVVAALFSITLFALLPVMDLLQFRKNVSISARTVHVDDADVLRLMTSRVSRNGAPPFSSHTCFGGGYTNTSWKLRTCYFRNLYTDGTHWYYLTKRRFEAKLITVALAPAAFRRDPPQFTVEVIVPQEFHEKIINLTALPRERRPAYYFMEYNGENFAHVLADGLFAAHSALHAFGLMHTNDDVKLPLKPVVALEQLRSDDSIKSYTCQWMKRQNWRAGKGWTNCKRFRKLLWPLLVQEFRSLAATSNSAMIYDKLVVGSGFLADHCDDRTQHGRSISEEDTCNQGRERQWYDFLQVIKRSVGASPSPNLKRFSVMIWDRHDNRAVSGWPNITSELSEVIERYSWVEGFQYIQDFSQYTLKEQIDMFSKTAVYMGSGGGGSFSALFLPRGSTAIRVSSSDCNLDWHLHNFLAHTHSQYICTQDVQMSLNLLLEQLEEALVRFAVFNDLQ